LVIYIIVSGMHGHKICKICSLHQHYGT